MDKHNESGVNDENTGNKATTTGLLNAAKSLGRLRDGPRRAILGDVSNSVASAELLSVQYHHLHTNPSLIVDGAR